MPHRLYPARTTLPDGSTLHPVAVWWDGRRARIFQAAQDRPGESPTSREIVEVWAASPTDVDVSGSIWTFTSEDGETVEASKSGGCGCGHPLKSFRPRN